MVGHVGKMIDVKGSQQPVDSAQIVMIADTYAIEATNGGKDARFVLTNEPAQEFAQRIIDADKGAAFVRTTQSDHVGNFVNVDFVSGTKDHAITLDVNPKFMNPDVPTDFPKADMDRKISDVANYALSREYKAQQPAVEQSFGEKVSKKLSSLFPKKNAELEVQPVEEKPKLAERRLPDISDINFGDRTNNFEK